MNKHIAALFALIALLSSPISALSGELLQLPTTATGHFGTNEIPSLPFELILTFDADGSGERVLASNLGTSDGMELRLMGTTLRLQVHTVGGLETFTATVDGDPHDVMVSFSSTGIDFEVDGSTESRMTATPDVASSVDFRLGPEAVTIGTPVDVLLTMFSIE